MEAIQTVIKQCKTKRMRFKHTIDHSRAKFKEQESKQLQNKEYENCHKSSVKTPRMSAHGYASDVNHYKICILGPCSAGVCLYSNASIPNLQQRIHHNYTEISTGMSTDE